MDKSLIDESTEEESSQDERESTDGETKIKDGILKPMEKYFVWTGQSSFPKSLPKRILYTLLQFVIASFVLLSFAYTSCFFPTKKTLYDISYYIIYYPITTLDQAVWDLRWLLTSWLGIWLTRAGIWQKIFDESMILKENRLKEVKTFSWRLVAALILMVFIQEFGICVEVDFEMTPSLWLGISLDLLFMLLDRLLAFPLFFLLCVTMYILCCMVEEYGEEIKHWPRKEKDEKKKTTDAKSEDAALDGQVSGQDGNKDGDAKDGDEVNKSEIVNEKEPDPQEQRQHIESESESEGVNSAREEFRKIKGAIRDAGQWFELYLILHFLLLLCTFFLGVCACFEQMEVRISKNYTIALPFEVSENFSTKHRFLPNSNMLL